MGRGKRWQEPFWNWFLTPFLALFSGSHLSGQTPYGPYIGHLFAGHSPDYIATNLPSYEQYVRGLYQALGGADFDGNFKIQALLQAAGNQQYNALTDLYGDSVGLAFSIKGIYVSFQSNETANGAAMMSLAKSNTFGYPFFYTPGLPIGAPGATNPFLPTPTRDGENAVSDDRRC